MHWTADSARIDGFCEKDDDQLHERQPCVSENLPIDPALQADWSTAVNLFLPVRFARMSKRSLGRSNSGR